METATSVPGIMCCILLAWAWGSVSSFLAFLFPVITSSGFEDCSETGSPLPMVFLMPTKCHQVMSAVSAPPHSRSLPLWRVFQAAPPHKKTFP